MSIIAIVVAAVFLIGIVLGVMVPFALAVRREDRRYSVAGHRGELYFSPPDGLARGARLLTAFT